MNVTDLSTILSGPPGPYAGIGARATPADVLELMADIGYCLARRGWTLRSGAAPGSDSAFDRGALEAGPFCYQIEIFLPWPQFNCYHDIARLAAPTGAAYQIAERHHPAWGKLKPTVRKLLARNTHQILGADCRSPSRFVLCWTPDGAVTAAETSRRSGGTGQAIRVAAAFGVPVLNLRRTDHRAAWEAFLKEAA